MEGVLKLQENSGTELYNYHYDQLNRLTTMDAWKADSSFSNLSKTDDYKEHFSYNADGGITNLLRHGAGRTVDSAAWNYNDNTHQLNHISDPAGRFGFDAGNQSANNYTYSPIGEMTSDAERGMTSIDWTVYGKIKSQTINGITINYLYDASGNRISKTVSGTNGYTESYVRDAGGNVMSIYRQQGSGDLVQSEVDLYGSGRLGVWKPNIDVDYLAPATDTIVPLLGTGYSLTFTRGEKLFDLQDHRGNVLAGVSDKKLQHTNDSATVDYYHADIVTAQDYSSFGSLLENRQFGTTPRRTYNDKELDKETGWQDYGMRPYLVDVPIFGEPDPLAPKYPELTPYQYASNRPIDGIDRDGAEHMSYIPKFNIEGRGVVDYAGGFDNGFIDILNTVPTLWNSGVTTVQNISRGTYGENLRRDFKQLGTGLKQVGTSVLKAPLKTLTSPEALEFVVSMYLGSKIPIPGGGNKGNLLSPAKNAASTDFSAIGSTGSVGENYLKTLGGEPQKYFATSLGARFVDQFVNGVANESKVGYTTLTKGIKMQIAKDEELLKNTAETGVEKVVWNFFKSPVTGKAGASKPLLEALKRAGIETRIIK